MDSERNDRIMANAVLTNLKAHRALRGLLSSTGNQPLVENAPGDYYWGCGKDGSGQNKLGQILEQVRDYVRSMLP